MEKKSIIHQRIIAILLALLIVLEIGAWCFLKKKSEIPALAPVYPLSSESTEAEDTQESYALEDEEAYRFAARMEDVTVTAGSGVSEADSNQEQASEGQEGEYLCSFSAERRMTQEDVAGIASESIENLPEGTTPVQMAVNEMYARHGYQFKNQDIQAYFEQKQWYNEIPERNSDMDAVYQGMTEIEKANVDMLSAYRGGCRIL